MSAYPRPVHCVECETDFRPEKNGVWLVEVASFGPYKIWHADLWKCPKCGKEIISGYSTHSTEHFEPGFSDLLIEAENSGKVYYNYEGR